MSAVNKFGISMRHLIPWPLWQAQLWVVYHSCTRDPAADMERGNGIRPKADDEQLRKPEVREVCLRSEIEAFRPGMRGLAWDARLLTFPWGFPLEEISVPVHLWHGSEDDQVPIAMARYIAGKIPSDKIILCEIEGQLALFSHWEEILNKLISE
jgi:pimeloyl-ACP methyl ester carboxylesterase